MHRNTLVFLTAVNLLIRPTVQHVLNIKAMKAYESQNSENIIRTWHTILWFACSCWCD